MQGLDLEDLFAMKYYIRIETNLPAGHVYNVEEFLHEIAASYGHKPKNLVIAVKF